MVRSKHVHAVELIKSRETFRDAVLSAPMMRDERETLNEEIATQRWSDQGKNARNSWARRFKVRMVVFVYSATLFALFEDSFPRVLFT